MDLSWGGGRAVLEDFVGEVFEFEAGGVFTAEEEVGDFFEGGGVGEDVDAVAAVGEAGAGFADGAEGSFAGAGAAKAGAGEGFGV